MEIDIGVFHWKFLVDRGDRNGDTVEVDTDTPVETFTDLLPIKIGLLMGDLGRMQENAVLNKPAHLVSRIGLTFSRHVVVVTIYRRDASKRASTHGAGGLETSVDFVVRKIDCERVLRIIEGEYADRRVHSKQGSVYAQYVQPAWRD
jgi:hypothetical protein